MNGILYSLNIKHTEVLKKTDSGGFQWEWPETTQPHQRCLFIHLKKKEKTISQHKTFSPKQISLLKAKTSDTSQPVLKCLWALLFPGLSKEPTFPLEALPSKTLSLTQNKLLDRFHIEKRS